MIRSKFETRGQKPDGGFKAVTQLEVEARAVIVEFIFLVGIPRRCGWGCRQQVDTRPTPTSAFTPPPNFPGRRRPCRRHRRWRPGASDRRDRRRSKVQLRRAINGGVCRRRLAILVLGTDIAVFEAAQVIGAAEEEALEDGRIRTVHCGCRSSGPCPRD